MHSPVPTHGTCSIVVGCCHFLLIKWLTSVSPLLEASYLRNRVWLGPCLSKINGRLCFSWGPAVYTFGLHPMSKECVENKNWRAGLQRLVPFLFLFFPILFFPLWRFILYYDPWTANRNMMNTLAEAVRNNFDMNRDHWNARWPGRCSPSVSKRCHSGHSSTVGPLGCVRGLVHEVWVLMSTLRG